VAEADREAVEQERIRALQEEARKLGYEAGQEQARATMEQETKRLRQLAESFGTALDSLDFRLADQVLNLALDVARQVIAGELAARPERILDVVNLALRQMAETTREARLLLNPEDAQLVRHILNDLLDRSRLRIVEDARIVRGGCLIETLQGDLDVTLQTRWRQVISVLGSNKNWLE
jgi:flagellar assembly protein FliH